MPLSPDTRLLQVLSEEDYGGFRGYGAGSQNSGWGALS